MPDSGSQQRGWEPATDLDGHGRFHDRNVPVNEAERVVLALANAFGQNMTTSDASASGAELQVEAPAALRGGLLYQVVFRVTAKTHLTSPVLHLSNGWFSGLTLNAEVPQPSQQTSAPSGPAFTLGEMQPGDQHTLRILFQVNSTTVAWRRSVNAEVDDDLALLEWSGSSCRGIVCRLSTLLGRGGWSTARPAYAR